MIVTKATRWSARQLIAIGGNSWSKPGTDEVRIYLDDWAGLAGLKITTYGTGNISHAELDGEKVSNGKACKLLGRIWWAGGEFHAEGVDVELWDRLFGGLWDRLDKGIAEALRKVGDQVSGDVAGQEFTGEVLDADGNPVTVPDGVEVTGEFRAFMAGRVPAGCGHYIAVSEARAGFGVCERC